jgi:hypothetical protein
MRFALALALAVGLAAQTETTYVEQAKGQDALVGKLPEPARQRLFFDASFGDSITACVGASDMTRCWVTVLGGDIRADLRNFGLSGALCADAGGLVLSTTSLNGGVFTYAFGANDSFWYPAQGGTSAASEAVFQACTAAEVAWLALASQNKFPATDSRINYAGSWVTDQSLYPFTSKGSDQVGATATAIVRGRAVYICSTWVAERTGAANGAFTVTVDGTLYGPYTTASPLGGDLIKTGPALQWPSGSVSCPHTGSRWDAYSGLHCDSRSACSY